MNLDGSLMAGTIVSQGRGISIVVLQVVTAKSAVSAGRAGVS